MSVVAVTGVGLLRRVGRQVAAGVVRIDRRATRAANADFDRISGLSPVVTSRSDHYTVDIDLLDPAFAPGVSHREPGGMSVRQLLSVVQRLEAPIVAADVVELNPRNDPTGASSFVAAKIVRELLGVMLARSD